ncbi:hypothetical protein [Butyricimonas virosa]|uniref:hypothetical protein n=1 Tax=Butyricimonas virosa TaxID=544645 RepID=UPI00217507D5|nr:hypothetical protein [Butyricimonas virosa]
MKKRQSFSGNSPPCSNRFLGDKFPKGTLEEFRDGINVIYIVRFATCFVFNLRDELIIDIQMVSKCRHAGSRL